MSEPNEYPDINKLILGKLSELPETILGYPVLDNGPAEVKLVQTTILETLKVIENHLELSFTDSDLIETGEGPDIQFEKIMVSTTVTDLATQYFDMVSN